MELQDGVQGLVGRYTAAEGNNYIRYYFIYPLFICVSYLYRLGRSIAMWWSVRRPVCWSHRRTMRWAMWGSVRRPMRRTMLRHGTLHWVLHGLLVRRTTGLLEECWVHVWSRRTMRSLRWTLLTEILHELYYKETGM